MKVRDILETMEYGPAPESRQNVDQWLEALDDTSSEEDLMNFLELCQTLLHNMVQQGRMSRVKRSMARIGP